MSWSGSLFKSSNASAGVDADWKDGFGASDLALSIKVLDSQSQSKIRSKIPGYVQMSRVRLSTWWRGGSHVDIL